MRSFRRGRTHRSFDDTNVYAREAPVKYRKPPVWTLSGPPLAAVSVHTRHPRPDVQSPDDDVSRHAVLLFSADPLAGALLAAAVELAGLAPHFVQRDESAKVALRRLRPRLVLIDCDHEESCSDEFVGPALMLGARVLLFRSRRTKRDTSDLAARLGVRVIEMPLTHEELTRLFAELLS